MYLSTGYPALRSARLSLVHEWIAQPVEGILDPLLPALDLGRGVRIERRLVDESPTQALFAVCRTREVPQIHDTPGC
jgi:hypothetical protein